MKEKSRKARRRIGAALLAAALFATSLQLPAAAQTMTGPRGVADTETPIVSLDFNSVTGTGLENSKFTDSYGTEATAVLDEKYKLTERETNHYLDLTGNKYLTVADENGASPLNGKDKITIIYDSYHLGNGAAWAFYADRDTNINGSLYCLGIREDWNRVDRFASEREEDASLTVFTNPLPTKTWKKMAVVVDATSVTVYQDGVEVGRTEKNTVESLSSILGNTSVLYIGKSNYENEYYNGFIDNFQIYDGALTAEEVASEEARATKELLADFDFENGTGNTFTYTKTTATEEGTTETISVTATATVPENSGELLKEEGGNNALDLRGSKKGLYVTKIDGTPILKGLKTATIVFDSYFEGNQSTNDWPFYAAKDIYPQSDKNVYADGENYIAMLENSTDLPQTSGVVRNVSDSTGKEDLGLSTGYSSSPSGPILNEWKTVAVVFDDAKTYFYVDGKLMDQNQIENGANLDDILGESGGVFQIGRANWYDGEFYNGMLDNFRIYDGALSEAEIASLYSDPNATTSATKIADFNFDDEQTGFIGSGAVARPFLTYDTDNDGSNELYFEEGNKTYLNLLQDTVSPLKGQEAITISYDSKPYGGKGWVFYAAEDDTAQVENKEKYIGIQNYAETIDVHNWNNKPSGFRLPSISTTLETHDWKHIDIIIDSEKTVLYVNGVKKDEVRSCYPLSTILGNTGGIAQIGKGNGETGQYYRGYIDNFQIYNKAIEPKVDSIRVTRAEGAEVTESGAIKVLAGHLQEYLNVEATLGTTKVTLDSDAYEVSGYKSQCGEQTVTLTYQGVSTTVKIDVYNIVQSEQTAVKGADGNNMFTIHSTWYDYLSDPEREGKGNYNSNSYVMLDKDGNLIDANDSADDGKEIVSSEAEYVQFNTAISKYWRRVGLDVTGDGTNGLDNRYFPIYWGDFYSLDEAYRNYDSNPDNNQNLTKYKYEPGEGVSFKRYGENFYGAVWGYNAHQYRTSAAQGIFDSTLGKDTNNEPAITIGNIVTPYFNEVSNALEGDEHGDVYMNIYEDVLMPFRTVEENGINYYVFESGDKGGETIYISDDKDNTVTYKKDNPCTDARLGTGDEYLDGYSFMPFNSECDKDTANCGFATKMDFSFYSTYDGKLLNKNGERVPIIFEFKGDDDFLLYIDGKLAIDIGGAHGQCTGTIDFAKQEVTVSSVREIETYAMTEARNSNDPSGPKESPVTVSFKELGLDFSNPATKHEAVIYYTERGKLEGNLKIKFNFPQENSVSVKNTVDASGVNESLQAQMKDIITNEKFPVDIASDYKTTDEELQAVSGETVAYHDGTQYTEGTITDGKVELKDGHSVLLVQRAQSSESEPGFLDKAGTLLSVKQTVNADKYTTTWKLVDTTGTELGNGSGTVIDDDKSNYPEGIANKDDEFALYNKDGQITSDESTGVEVINLSAEYTNTVRTNSISIKKEMRAGETSDDTFLFQVTLSNLFGSGSEASVYNGSYTLHKTDNTTVEETTTADGYIELKPGEKAEITGIPALTNYVIRENIAAGTYSNKNGYQTVGSPEISGTIDADVEVVDNVITNMEKNATEFYAWRGQETVLPISGVKAVYDANGNETATYTPTDRSYTVTKTENVDDQLQFVGNEYGNIVIEYKDVNDKKATATIHVYEPDNKAYVLDYGLPVDLNQAGNDSFGISLIEGQTDKYTVSGSRLSIGSTSTVAEFLGFRSHKEDYSNWIYNETASNDGKSELSWNDLTATYTPAAFMESADVYDYRVDVKKSLAINMDAEDSTSEDGVRMAGTVTVVPAEVVYYEDDFSAIKVSGNSGTEGVREELMQSNDQDGVYGYDEVYSDEVTIEKNLILQYDFSKMTKADDGATVPDVSGNNNDGTIHQSGATVNGEVLTLSGTEHTTAPYIELPSTIAEGKTALTVSIWLKSERASWTNAAFYLGEDKDSPSYYCMINPRTDTNKMRMLATKNGNTQEKEVGLSELSATGEWALYTMVLEDNQLTAYYNGVYVGKQTDTGINVSDIATNAAAYIGNSGWLMDYYDGDIRDVRIYDRALTEQEVSGLYNGLLDSAGSCTRLDASDSANRGTMEFTFQGRGFDLIGRSTTDTAGLAVIVREHSDSGTAGALVKSTIVDTSYANGKLYQLPIVSIKDLEYGKYDVTVKAMRTQNRADETVINTFVYIDAIRIYDPANTMGETSSKGAVSKYYLNSEYQSDVAEVRELLLGSVKFENLDAILKNLDNTGESSTESGTTTASSSSSVSLVAVDSDLGVTMYHAGDAQVENPDTGATIDPVDSLERILKRGPNNEVYLAEGNAIAFHVIPATDGEGNALIAEADRTIQIEAKKVADDQKSSAEFKLLTNDNSKAQTVKLTTYTPMYYEINLANCKQYADGSYLVILASTGQSMVSLTNLKVKGYTLQAIDSADISDNPDKVSTLAADTYSFMRAMFIAEAEDPDSGTDTDTDKDTDNDTNPDTDPDKDTDPDTDPDTGKDPDSGTDPDPADDSKVLPFVDVPAGSWYESYIRYVYNKEIMTGLDETHFGPDQTICRAQFAVILYRMAGSPKVEYTDTFKDVPKGQFYTDAVIWASQKNVGVITGYTSGDKEGCFGPSDSITREQIAVMMYRYAQYKNENVKASSDMSEFEDRGQVSAFAKDAVAWAISEKLIQGDQGMIHPQGNTNRAMCAAIIQRFLER